MKHIVVTKFNLPDGSGKHIDEDWLEDRLQLFESWALPSMLAQTFTDFVWLIFCWKHTPERFLPRMQAYGNVDERVKPQFLGGRGWPAVMEDWMSRIYYHAEPGTVFTTRIDSDDAIRKDYLERVRAIAEPGVWVGFLRGFMCRDNQVYLRSYQNNPFLTYSEEVKDVRDLETVNKYPHPKVPRIAYVETEEPGWLQHAHDNTGWNKDTLHEADMLTDWMPLDNVREDFGI